MRMAAARRLYSPTRPERRSTQTGVTLVEVIVYCFMLGLLVAAIYSVLTGSVTYYLVGANAIQLQQCAASAATRVTRELAESDPGSVVTTSTPPSLIFASPRTSPYGTYAYNSNGNLLWQGWVCYSIGSANGAPALLRRELMLASPVSAPPAASSAPSLATLNGSTGPAVSWTGFSVSSFSATGTSLVQLTFTATGNPSVPNWHGAGIVNSVQVQTSVHPHN